MNRGWRNTCVLALAAVISACGHTARYPVSAGTGPDPVLPPPPGNLFPTVKIAPARGWQRGEQPQAADGLRVVAFATGLDHPRWLHVLPNGDVLVAESNAPAKSGSEGIKGWIMKRVKKAAGAGVPSADRISLLRDGDGDGVAEQRSVFLEDLHSPFGMALIGDDLYVANTDAVLRFPYSEGQMRIDTPGTRVVDLPVGRFNQHWTRNLLAAPDGRQLYVAVGSASNIAEHGLAEEEGRAAIWQVEPTSGVHRIFGSGLRNPVGMAWEPDTGALWTVVNERDELGSDLVPDFLTRVRAGAFYGWPFSYFGQHVDTRVKPQRPELVAKAIVPDYALGPHTASLGLAHSQGNRLPARFAQGMFVGQHGSWNRSPRSGYKVIFVPFKNGMPAGPPLDVLTGFVDAEGKARGRPVGVALDRQGALLVADDVGNVIWRVTATGSR